MKRITLRRIRTIFLAFAFLVAANLLYAGNLILKHERPVTIGGRTIAYQTVQLSDPSQLPQGSPWRDYLNTRLDNGMTIYQYAKTASSALSKDMVLTLSDANGNSFSSRSKIDNTYNIHLYDYLNRFESSRNKSYIFLHEFAHVVMLNSYPPSYNFGNLDYGSNGVHYLDDILPNHNTAWVEGWANGFAAHNNGGMIYDYDLNRSDCTAFLKRNTFDEMARNELFVAKVIYDAIRKIPGGQDSVYEAIARTSPHYSLQEFSAQYTARYPQNKVAMAKILFEASHGNISLDEMLAYVNNGSKKVSRDLYNYLDASGLLSAPQKKPTPPPTSYAGTSGKTGFWDVIGDFFKKIFAFFKPSSRESAPLLPDYSAAVAAASRGVSEPSSVEAYAPEERNESHHYYLSEEALRAQKDYYKYLKQYNALMATKSPDMKKVKQVRDKLIEAKRIMRKYGVQHKH